MTGKPDALRILEWLLTVSALFGMVWGMFWFMDYRHAKQHALLEVKLDIQTEELDREIREKSEVRYYYQRKRDLGTADEADESRLKYLETTLERKYERQAELREKQDALAKEDQ